MAEGGDVVAALSSGATPRITGLTDPFGEAISYTTDGKQFVTVSDGGQLGEDEEIQILSYPPAAASAATAGATAGAAAGDGGSLIDNLSLKDITTLIAAIGVIGLILVAAGVAGIIVARKKKAAAGPDGAGVAQVGRQVAPEQATWDQDGPSGNVYGGRPAPGGGVYGGQPAPGGRRCLRRWTGRSAAWWRRLRRAAAGSPPVAASTAAGGGAPAAAVRTAVVVVRGRATAMVRRSRAGDSAAPATAGPRNAPDDYDQPGPDGYSGYVALRLPPRLPAAELFSP